jgi:hypothetical protein
MASNVGTPTTELRIRIPKFTVDFTPEGSPEISPIPFVGEDGQMWQGEQENQEQGCQEQESDAAIEAMKKRFALRKLSESERALLGVG